MGVHKVFQANDESDVSTKHEVSDVFIHSFSSDPKGRDREEPAGSGSPIVPQLSQTTALIHGLIVSTCHSLVSST